MMNPIHVYYNQFSLYFFYILWIVDFPISYIYSINVDYRIGISWDTYLRFLIFYMEGIVRIPTIMASMEGPVVGSFKNVPRK